MTTRHEPLLLSVTLDPCPTSHPLDPRYPRLQSRFSRPGAGSIDQSLMLPQHSNKVTGVQWRYIQNKNKYFDSFKFSYESRSYLETNSTQNLGHIG